LITVSGKAGWFLSLRVRRRALRPDEKLKLNKVVGGKC
jgi:hypothetical protein